MQTANGFIRVLVVMAHPDDAEYKAGGVAAKWAALGHHVKFVSVTNGDIGHWQIAGGPLAKPAHHVTSGDKLLESRLRSRKKPFAGFGQSDTARGAYEERCADARLECPYRLADRRWRHPELRGCSAETAVLGNAQERLHAIERALPDCEVLLHGPSTLSRLIARGKWPYI